MAEERRRLETTAAAEYLHAVHGLNVSPRSLAQWRWRGTGPDCEYFRNRPVYHSAALDAWVEENTGDRNPLIEARARTRAQREAERAAAAPGTPALPRRVIAGVAT